MTAWCCKVALLKTGRHAFIMTVCRYATFIPTQSKSEAIMLLALPTFCIIYHYHYWTCLTKSQTICVWFSDCKKPAVTCWSALVMQSDWYSCFSAMKSVMWLTGSSLTTTASSFILLFYMLIYIHQNSKCTWRRPHSPLWHLAVLVQLKYGATNP